MKRIITLLFGLSFLLPFTVSAQGLSNLDRANEEDYENIILTRDQVVEDDYFAAGGNVEISGTVNGDVYAAGGQVVVDGTVNGDLLAAGGSLLISGEITEDVRVAGGNITITGTITGNLTAVGGNITITKEAAVQGNVVTAGGNVLIYSPVAGSVRAGAGNLTISNTVGKDVEAGIGQLRLASGAVVAGNVLYWSEDDLTLDPGAQVLGEVEKRQVTKPDVETRELQSAAAGFDLFTTLMSAVTSFVLGALLIGLSPKLDQKASKIISSRVLFSAGLGFLALVLTPLFAVALVITVLGIPLGILLLVLYIIVLYVARIYVMTWLGKQVLKNKSPYLTLLVGLIIYYLVGIAPIIGPLLKFLAMLIGLGALIIAKRDLYQQAKKKELA